MPYLFTSESVSSGHPDKVADIISDTLLDYFLSFDSSSRVACETMVTTGQVIIAGEVTSSTYLDIQNIVREVINSIGYNDGKLQFSGNSCGVLSMIHEQSKNISDGISNQNPLELGAGDQGLMFCYACNETENLIPLSLDLSHKIMRFLENQRKNNSDFNYLRPDSKAQVTVKYSDDHQIIGVDSIVVSTQHDDFNNQNNLSLDKIRDEIEIHLRSFLNTYKSRYHELFKDTRFIINPAGKFVIGGPHGDTGLTGRKIIVDTYGGKGSHGGGAFSGKDSTKVDRSAAYMARYLAKNLVYAGIADELQIQLAYAIGLKNPVSININTFGKSKINLSDSEIALIVKQNFDLSPYKIQEELKLRNPIFKETAVYGHFGRDPQKVKKIFSSPYNGKKEIEVELFSWEKLNIVKKIKDIFEINE